jgi:hypothetical protein
VDSPFWLAGDDFVFDLSGSEHRRDDAGLVIWQGPVSDCDGNQLRTWAECYSAAGEWHEVRANFGDVVCRLTNVEEPLDVAYFRTHLRSLRRRPAYCDRNYHLVSDGAGSELGRVERRAHANERIAAVHGTDVAAFLVREHCRWPVVRSDGTELALLTLIPGRRKWFAVGRDPARCEVRLRRSVDDPALRLVIMGYVFMLYEAWQFRNND